jgi:hypothetical protein
MVVHLKNFSSTFAQIPNRIADVEFITVSPTIANTMLAVVILYIRFDFSIFEFFNCS